jgi:hypothetical protein
VTRATLFDSLCKPSNSALLQLPACPLARLIIHRCPSSFS